MRLSLLVGLTLVIVSFVGLSEPVAGSHWCSPATIYSNPSSGYVGDTTSFSFQLNDNIGDALTVYHFYVTFSWSGTQWDLGSATIPGYGSNTFYKTIVLPSSAGSYTISLIVDGQASSDLFGATCTFSPRTFTVLPYTPPTLSATANPNSGTAPLTVTFTASVSGGIPPYSYAWAFGDGGSGGGSMTTYTYASAGTFTAQATVTDGKSNSASATAIVTVRQPIPPLTATAAADVSSGTIPFTVAFSASASGGTAPYTFSWDFGDGGSSTQQNPSHTYQVAGTYTVRVVVTESGGTSLTKILTVTATASALVGSGQGVPLWVIYILAGVIVVVALSLFLVRRRKATRPPP